MIKKSIRYNIRSFKYTTSYGNLFINSENNLYSKDYDYDLHIRSERNLCNIAKYSTKKEFFRKLFGKSRYNKYSQYEYKNNTIRPRFKKTLYDISTVGHRKYEKYFIT